MSSFQCLHLKWHDQQTIRTGLACRPSEWLGQNFRQFYIVHCHEIISEMQHSPSPLILRRTSRCCCVSDQNVCGNRGL